MRFAIAVFILLRGVAFAAAVDDAEKAIRDQDFGRAIALLEPESARGVARATTRLADLYKYGRGVPEDHRKAVALYQKAIAGGDALGAYDLYFAYSYGDGVEASTAAAAAFAPKALALMKAAAQKGDIDCMDRVSRFYDYGHGTPVNRAESIAWREKYLAGLLSKAKAGDAYFQYKVGLEYSWAPPPLKDFETARTWLKRAADQGYPEAMVALGDLMDGHHSLPKDEAGAQALYQKAAEAGSSLAYMMLATSSKEPAKSTEMYHRCAEAGSAYCAVQLAQRYQNGEGIEKSSSEAVKWAYRAAKAGEPSGQAFLAKAYRPGGDGVQEDRAEAYKWAVLASWQGSRGPLEEMGAATTASERAEGRARAHAFKAVAFEFPYRTLRRTAAVAAPAAPEKTESAGVPVAAARLKERPDDYALIVGIEHYRGLPEAAYAEADAASVRERLVALGFPERNIISLTGEEATRSKLHAYLDEWLPKNTNMGSRVFFYFSGHGSPDVKTGQAYLIPADGDPQFLKSTAYPLKDLYAALDALPARQIIVALDSCFSGAGGRSVLAKGMRPLVNVVEMAESSGSARRIVLAAAAGDQVTGGLDAQGHGAFTYFLLEGLAGAAKAEDGTITAGGLEDYLKPRVADAARRQNRNQTPVLYGDPKALLFRME